MQFQVEVVGISIPKSCQYVNIAYPNEFKLLSLVSPAGEEGLGK
jgi:hypothetical protein